MAKPAFGWKRSLDVLRNNVRIGPFAKINTRAGSGHSLRRAPTAAMHSSELCKVWPASRQGTFVSRGRELGKSRDLPMLRGARMYAIMRATKNRQQLHEV